VFSRHPRRGPQFVPQLPGDLHPAVAAVHEAGFGINRTSNGHLRWPITSGSSAAVRRRERGQLRRGIGAHDDRSWSHFRHPADPRGRAASARHFARREDLTRETKGPQDFVSIADREVESLIHTRLAEAFPTDGFLGEESGGEIGERSCVIDPIDGTNNFLRGLPLWSVSIAYAIAGEPVIGLIHLPCVGRLYSAVRGGGAWCDGMLIHASRVADLAQATIAVGISRRTSPDLSLPVIEIALRNGSALRCMGTCVVALAMVAEGSVDAYYEVHVQPWDCLAGILIVSEAGGRTNEVAVGFVGVTG
jgi:myo-inositol-1(or 4)-monophosphatase